jgi:hypothetical protein
MSLSSYCRNCGDPYTTVSEMSALHCNGCEQARTEAMTHATAQAEEQKKTIAPDDLLYIGRQALMQRAHHPRQTFISPREFNRADMERR